MKTFFSICGLLLALLFTSASFAADADNKDCQEISITTPSLPSGIVGQPYSARLSSSGGIPPIIWGLGKDTGALPKGLSLSPSGVISGTPIAYEKAKFIVVAVAKCSTEKISDRKFLAVAINTPATAALTIKRLQLSFDNGRSETTVKRNQPGLRVKADIRFYGSGLLKGFWEVDGRLLATVNEHLVYGKSIQLSSPTVPLLPTFVEGSHRVRLVITDPVLDNVLPEAIYYVISEESTVGRANIIIVKPHNYAELVFAPQSFNWVGTDDVTYLVEFYDKASKERVAAAYIKGTGYNLPEKILNKKFNTGKTYKWEIRGYDVEGNLISVSEPSYFIFR